MPRLHERSGARSPTSFAPSCELAVFLDEAETDVLAYMTLPPQHRTKLHSTNPMERLFPNGVPSRSIKTSARYSLIVLNAFDTLHAGEAPDWNLFLAS
jgi:hypothetical protein